MTLHKSIFGISVPAIQTNFLGWISILFFCFYWLLINRSFKQLYGSIFSLQMFIFKPEVRLVSKNFRPFLALYLMVTEVIRHKISGSDFCLLARFSVLSYVERTDYPNLEIFQIEKKSKSCFWNILPHRTINYGTKGAYGYHVMAFLQKCPP